MLTREKLTNEEWAAVRNAPHPVRTPESVQGKALESMQQAPGETEFITQLRKLKAPESS